MLGVVALLALVYFAATRPQVVETPDGANVKVAATIFPVYDLVRIVGGEQVRAELILPPGASPHTFDPTPSELKRLQGADLVFTIGEGIDAWAAGIAENIPGSKIIELNRGITLREAADHDEHEDEAGDDGNVVPADNDEEHESDEADEHETFDPHYWLDPFNAIIMTEVITEALVELDPAQAEVYRTNAETFITRLRQHDALWQEKLRQLPKRDLVTFHDAFFYFADHFGLRVLATFEPFPGKEPTPSYLRELQEAIEEHNIRHMFTEPQLYGASLKQFAKDNNVSISVLDPLGGVAARASYIELIDFNVNALHDALQQ